MEFPPMRKKIGITCGKFMPFHKGHELMIDTAAEALDKVYVIVAGLETDEIPLMARYRMVRNTYKGNPKVKVVRFVDEITYEGQPDEHGTVLDPVFWEKWIAVFQHVAPKATHFFSSDMYGKVAAQKMGIRWLPIDPRREMAATSGTRIRENINANWNFMTQEARRYFTKRVAIVGPESTGKSTLTSQLAGVFETSFANEWGRAICEAADGNLTEEDFNEIAVMQDALIKNAVKNANRVMFTDTEAYTTYLFGKQYLNKNLGHIKQRAINQKFDLYILLAPTVEWVQDGTRILADYEVRRQFFDDLQAFLDENKKPYIILSHPYFAERTMHAIRAVKDLLTAQ